MKIAVDLHLPANEAERPSPEPNNSPERELLNEGFFYGWRRNSDLIAELRRVLSFNDFSDSLAGGKNAASS
jgi:hypothetical protein